MVSKIGRGLFSPVVKTPGWCRKSAVGFLVQWLRHPDVTPSATDSQAQAGSGMIFRMRPTKSEWTAWRGVGPGVRYWDYEVGMARFSTPAQRTAGITGPIVGASEIRLRFALRLGQEQCTHTRSGRATGAQVAQVIVF
jgi:hypothetical protein